MAADKGQKPVWGGQGQCCLVSCGLCTSQMTWHHLGSVWDSSAAAALPVSGTTFYKSCKDSIVINYISNWFAMPRLSFLPETVIIRDSTCPNHKLFTLLLFSNVTTEYRAQLPGDHTVKLQQQPEHILTESQGKWMRNSRPEGGGHIRWLEWREQQGYCRTAGRGMVWNDRRVGKHAHASAVTVIMPFFCVDGLASLEVKRSPCRKSTTNVIDNACTKPERCPVGVMWM